MLQPFRLGALELKNRVIVSPMDKYSAVDGVHGDFHLVHLGSKAMGGAGLVMTEMVCVSPGARITPGRGGRKGSTRLMWEGMDERLRLALVRDGNENTDNPFHLRWAPADERTAA